MSETATATRHAEILILGGGILGCSHRLSPDARGQARRRHPGKERPDPWRDLARRGPGRPAPLLAQHHAHAEALGRALRPARGGDRAGDRLEEIRLAAPRLLRAARDGEPPPDDHGEELRSRDAVALAAAVAGAVPADEHRGRALRDLHPERRLYRSRQRRAGAGQGRQGQGRQDRDRRARHRLHGRERARHADRDRQGRLDLRPAGQLRCGMWGHEVGKLAGVRVPSFAVEHQYLDHRSDPRRAQAHADHARSRSPGLLQAGGARPGGRRLRAGHASLSRRAASRAPSRRSCCPATSTASSSWRSSRPSARPSSTRSACGNC